jgi:capsular polysaccharide biosynthesis protein
MKIISVRNVFLTRSGIGLKRLRLIDETIALYPGKRKHFWQYALFQFFFRKKIQLKGNYFVIHNHWCPGYYHWITEALPRLLAVRISLTDHILVLPASFKEKLSPSLLPLYTGEILWIPQDSNLKIENLLIPANPLSGAYDDLVMNELRDIYVRYAAKLLARADYRSRIYVSRRKALQRKVDNEAEVEKFLSSYGFQLVCFEELGFWEQVNVMRHAQVVISIHGAGLSNALFMTEGSMLIELQRHPGDEAVDVLYKDLSAALALRYAVLFCAPTVSAMPLKSADISVPLDELKSILIHSLGQ